MSEEFKPEAYFDLLQALRESGTMNMFEAPRWLQKEMDLTREQAVETFKAWTQTFKDD